MILTLENIDKIHMVKERTAGSHIKPALYKTKCGREITYDPTANVTLWDSDVTCPGCAIPWV